MRKLFILLMIVTFTAGMAGASHAAILNIQGNYTGSRTGIQVDPTASNGFATFVITMTVNVTYQSVDGTLLGGTMVSTHPGPGGPVTENQTFTGKITGDDNLYLTVIDSNGAVNSVVFGKLDTSYTIKGVWQNINNGGPTGDFTVKR